MKIYFDALDPKFGGIIGNNSWSLCIGAGISFGMVPTWMELARRVFNRTYGVLYDTKKFKKLVEVTGFSLDSWFQNCLNHVKETGKSESTFYNCLKEELYNDILGRAKISGVENDLIQGLHYPFAFKPEQIEQLCDFFETEFTNSSNNQLARVLAKSFTTKKPPKTVISFNADAILNLVVYLFQMRVSLNSKDDETNFETRSLKRIIQSIELAGKAKNGQKFIPLYHLHGSLFPNPNGKIKYERKESLNKLIFDEDAYLNISGSIYSWAQSTFLYHAQTDDIVFVGLSMTDSNIRKWLAWTHQNKLLELKMANGRGIKTLNHVWITTRPAKKEQEMIIANSMYHLGVKTAFIDDWSQLQSGLSNIIGVKLKSH